MDDKKFTTTINFSLEVYDLVKQVQSEINSKYAIGANNLFYILTVVANEGLNQEKIGDLLWINKSKVARTLNQLEDDGFLERHQDRSNRRQNKIYSTDKGKNVSQETFSLYQKLINSSEKLKEQNIIDIVKASFIIE